MSDENELKEVLEEIYKLKAKMPNHAFCVREPLWPFPCEGYYWDDSQKKWIYGCVDEEDRSNTRRVSRDKYDTELEVAQRLLRQMQFFMRTEKH